MMTDGKTDGQGDYYGASVDTRHPLKINELTQFGINVLNENFLALPEGNPFLQNSISRLRRASSYREIDRKYQELSPFVKKKTEKCGVHIILNTVELQWLEH